MLLDDARSSAATGTGRRAAIVTTVTMQPLRVNPQKEIGVAVVSAMPSMTTLALAPMAVTFPPKSAPSASAHHSDVGLRGSGMPADESQTIGLMVAT